MAKKRKTLLALSTSILLASVLIVSSVFLLYKEGKEDNPTPIVVDGDYGEQVSRIGDIYVYNFRLDNGKSYFYTYHEEEDGTKILSGSTVPPSELGKNGDTFIDRFSKKYYYNSNGIWVFIGAISETNDDVPYVGSNGNWWIGRTDTRISVTGTSGKSAYELYLETHPEYTKSELQWIADIQNGTLDTRITFLVEFDSDGGTPVSSQLVKEGDFVTEPIAPTKEGYDFAGWYYENIEWNFSSNVALSNFSLVANWTRALNDFSYAPNNPAAGKTYLIAGDGYTDDNMTVMAETIGDAVFKGWYEEDIKLTNETEYSFVMPASDYSISAKFFTAEEQRTWDINHGVIPSKVDENTIKYGMFPQTIVSDVALIDTLNSLKVVEDNGYYEYENELYFADRANPHGDAKYFSNDEQIITGRTYWYKVEPILWDIIGNSGNEYKIVSRTVLTAMTYGVRGGDSTLGTHGSNYKESNVREWLNDGFLEKASFNLDYLLDKTIDNSKESAGLSNDDFTCENTTDKVSILSYSEMVDCVENGLTFTYFPSDYSKAAGSYGFADGSTFCWTRSPSGADVIKSIDGEGKFTTGWVDYRMFGVKPCVYIELEP